MKLLDSFKSLSPLEIVLLVVFIIFIIFPFKLPLMVSNMINSQVGFLSLFVITLYLFFYTNPILGVIYIFVAYELIRRSSVMSGKPVMGQQYIPSQKNKDAELVKMNPPKELTLEEEVIQTMAPARNDFIKVNSTSEYKPVMESIVGASMF
jgi:hypothetical protein